MARQKDGLKSGMGKAMRVFTALIEAVEDLGGSDENVRRIESDEALRLDLAKRIVGNVKPALECLKLVAKNVVSVGVFTKDSFFENGPAKLWFGDNFKRRILSEIPKNIPTFEASLSKFELVKLMSDSEIQGELGHPEPFTLSEFAAVVKTLLEKQPKGEQGTLLTNGYANIFYVKLEDGCVVAVRVRWRSDYREWRLFAYALGGRGWRDGDCVFSRS